MMRFFVDGSALAKRYVAEPGTPLMDHLFSQVTANRLFVLNVGFAEVVSVMVRRRNAGAITTTTFSQAMLHLGQEIIHAASIRKLEPTNALVIASLAHIEKHSINATDAIVLHATLGLAQFLRVNGDDLAIVASDQRLLRAAKAEGLDTFDPETQDQAALSKLIGP